MKLIVGLGNPGRRYANSRHNVGFRVLDELAKGIGPRAKSFKKELRFQAEVSALRATPSALSVILAKPQTYMNESGKAVAAIAKFYKIKPKDILVVSDDIDMEFGKTRMRTEGGSGGHRGLQSIIEYLKTEKFPRLKIGIGRDPKIEADVYVLHKFTAEQNKKLPSIIQEAIQEIEKWTEKNK
jgi:PTH1 family peptidyl-tRNA hydrolase